MEREISEKGRGLEEAQEPSIPPSLLVSATYDGQAKVAVLKFYDPHTQTIHRWYDDTGHKPYCYSKLSIDDLKDLKSRPDVLDLKVKKKKDLLRDTDVTLTKIIVDNPLVIGGSSSEKSIRNVIDAWEADIKYYENYLYDKGLMVGAFYEEKDSKTVPVEYEVPKVAKESLKKVLDKSDPDFKSHILEWIRLLSQPLPSIRRASLDIEVLPPAEMRIPDPVKAEFPVLAVSIVGSDEVQEVFLLKREEIELGQKKIGDHVKVYFFEDEKELISSVFKRILDYPFLITFNGDDFDLNYLYHRAIKFVFPKEQIPILLGRDVAYVEHGVHIDLYKIFRNKSLQIYAFGNRYIEHTLNGVSKALIKESKMKFEGALGSLPLYELAKYCYNDALITYKLTNFNDDLLMKLLLVIARVAKMPIDDVARLGVSNWIRSMMYFEHRKINALIPKKDELEEKGGAVSEPITKGKKYKGALVVEPKTGVHFNVLVLDFASLYPSIIKVYNLSYETVNCIHPEDKRNFIPGTKQWVCKKRKGISSLVIGSLRDLRVNYYKPLSKDSSLSPDDKSLYNIVTQALKVILNASYGVMGAEIYPLYCLPVAEATAAIGRYIISKTIEKCKELGINVVYGDTDSLFLESPIEAQIKRIQRWAEDELKIELDLEKTYRYVAFSQRKKNYLGVLLDGSVDIKGLTGKKRHIPPFIKNAFYEVVNTLSQVKSSNDFGKAREAIKKQLREKYLLLRSRKIPLEEMAFNVMMSKDISRYTETQPQHVKVAKLMKESGQDVKAGEIISFVKTKTPLGVKPLNLAKIDEIDTEKYLDYLRGTFEQLLDALGYSFDEILGTTKLEDFFWSQ
ncbi:MAG: DNA-directed DNA polymerase I [Candidatus Methylarchaceae archaeon HK01B]|nr:DNA-directed DNA polymerase I [Candidatus Methylarchaceae archaeon HK01B]